jgi:hypothetical protein
MAKVLLKSRGLTKLSKTTCPPLVNSLVKFITFIPSILHQLQLRQSFADKIFNTIYENNCSSKVSTVAFSAGFVWISFPVLTVVIDL